MIVRDATRWDLARIRDLYNGLIESTTGAWTEIPETLQERERWFARQRDAHFPVLVAEHGRDVVGYAAYGSFRGEGRWPGYRYTVEHSIHVDESMWGCGVGRALMDELVKRASASSIHVMVAAVDGANEASIAFHQRLGFEIVGRMPETGIKFGRWLDLVLMQRILGDDSR